MITRPDDADKFRANLVLAGRKPPYLRALYCGMPNIASHYRAIRSPRQASGFILVATLFAIAVIAIGAAYFASRVEGLQTAAFQQQALAEAEREAVSIGQTLMQAVLLNPITERGLVIKTAPKEPLLLDGRFYRLSDKTEIAVQDERGLISLNVNEDRQLRRFFSAVGLPAERHDRLIDTLRDYVDIDDLKRLNGAERRDYIEAKLPPPANDFFVSRDELRRIPGWRDLLAELETHGKPGAAERFLSYFSAHRIMAINLNTAPRLVVQALAGIDQTRITALLDQRRMTPFQNAADLVPFTNGPIDFEDIQLVGANTWRLTYQRDDLAFLIECRLVITPVASLKAAQVNECRHRPRNSLISDDDADDFARVFSAGVSGLAKSPNNDRERSNKNSLPNFRSSLINREVSQRASDNRSLSWLKLQTGLTAANASASAALAQPRQ